jgi:hypothetical protein
MAFNVEIVDSRLLSFTGFFFSLSTWLTANESSTTIYKNRD